MCVACKCVGVLGGVCLCWVVVELLTCVWCGVLLIDTITRCNKTIFLLCSRRYTFVTYCTFDLILLSHLRLVLHNVLFILQVLHVQHVSCSLT
jgi:hypothetical protein